MTLNLGAIPAQIKEEVPQTAGKISFPLTLPTTGLAPEQPKPLDTILNLQLPIEPQIQQSLALKIPIPEEATPQNQPEASSVTKATPKARGRKPKGDKPPGQKKRVRKERRNTAKELEIAKADSIDIQPNTFSADKDSHSVSFQSPKAVGNLKIKDDQDMDSPAESTNRRKSLFSITKFDRPPSSHQINPFDEM
mmetsp:Transcript_39849/g.61040  ORF Transcript_39849/g.61040 Transcript_39849/m.61040 type:complete len:194 (+) Transcript_39849:225-806(+)